jgi:hypothetical protein
MLPAPWRRTLAQSLKPGNGPGLFLMWRPERAVTIVV